jgi:hypothetical protein
VCARVHERECKKTAILCSEKEAEMESETENKGLRKEGCFQKELMIFFCDFIGESFYFRQFSAQ